MKKSCRRKKQYKLHAKTDGAELEQKLNLYDNDHHRHNGEKSLIYEGLLIYKSKNVTKWTQGWFTLTIDEYDKIWLGCDNKNIGQCGKILCSNAIRLITFPDYNVKMLREMPNCLNLINCNDVQSFKCKKRLSFIYTPRFSKDNFLFAALNATDFMKWLMIIGRCVNGITNTSLKELIQHPFIHYDKYNEKFSVY